jgi:hypothetical protein
MPKPGSLQLSSKSSMDMYHYYSCLAARETVVGGLPLGQKTQIKARGSMLGYEYYW